MSLRSLSVSRQVICPHHHKCTKPWWCLWLWRMALPVPGRAAPPLTPTNNLGALHWWWPRCQLCLTRQSGSQRRPGWGGPHKVEALLSPPPTPPEKKAKTVLRAHPPKQDGWVRPLGWLLHRPLLNQRLWFTGVSRVIQLLTLTKHTSELPVVPNEVCDLHCHNTGSKLWLSLTKERRDG